MIIDYKLIQKLPVVLTANYHRISKTTCISSSRYTDQRGSLPFGPSRGRYNLSKYGTLKLIVTKLLNKWIFLFLQLQEVLDWLSLNIFRSWAMSIFMALLEVTRNAKWHKIWVAKELSTTENIIRDYSLIRNHLKKTFSQWWEKKRLISTTKMSAKICLAQPSL